MKNFITWQVEEYEMGRAYSTNGNYSYIGGKVDRKETLGRPRHRWRVILTWILE
jgi:hypothetical protein